MRGKKKSMGKKPGMKKMSKAAKRPMFGKIGKKTKKRK
jgi:hypothetical protein|tara:strand:- start:853 stop:966 length:114 start_codon:yes stop_codon:yes gene_type:complete